MTRFSLSTNKAINMVIWSIKNSIGQEIVVPKTPSYKILDLVAAFSKNPKIKIIGLRPGEKLHEELISENDSLNTLETKDYYILCQKIVKPTHTIKIELKLNQLEWFFL